jgi:hypothetical protein
MAETNGLVEGGAPAAASRVLEEGEPYGARATPARRAHRWVGAAESPEGEGLFRTCRSVLFAPHAFFARPPGWRSRLAPSAFALRVAALAVPAGGFSGALAEGKGPRAALGDALLGLAVSPLAALFGLLLGGGLVHVWLRLVCAKPLPFAETLECAAYASAATLCGVVPVVGDVIALIWYAALFAVAMVRVHGGPRGRVVFAVLAGVASPAALALGARLWLGAT